MPQLTPEDYIRLGWLAAAHQSRRTGEAIGEVTGQMMGRVSEVLVGMLENPTLHLVVTDLATVAVDKGIVEARELAVKGGRA